MQRFYEKRHHDCYLCKRFNFYEIQFRDNLLIKECFERTFRNKRFKFVHLLFRHDNLQKSKIQTINFESKCLRWTNVKKSWNVKLQIINHFHERFMSFNKNLKWVYCWKKSQNQLSINREIIDVHHAKNSIEHNLFYLDDNRYVFNLIQTHWQAIKRIFCYLRKTHQMKLMFREALKSLKNYTNLNWAKDQDIKRSILKYAFNVDNDVINWFSKRQFIVILFICKIEYTKQIFNRKKSDLITKSDDSIDMRRRIFSNDNDIRKQSKRYCFNQKFSISRTHQAHRYSHSLHQRENDRRFHRLNLRVYRLNDNWRFDKIINQRQICSISRRSKDRIIISLSKALSRQQSVRFYQCLATAICESLSRLLLSSSSRQSSMKVK
jgi:hypothetical protein